MQYPKIRPINASIVNNIVNNMQHYRSNGHDCIVISPNGKYAAHYYYFGELRFGPAHCKLKILSNNESQNIIWDGGERDFGFPSSEHFTPWSSDSSKIGLIEWHSFLGTNESPVIINIEDKSELSLNNASHYRMQFIPGDQDSVVALTLDTDGFFSPILIDKNGHLQKLGNSIMYRDTLIADSSMTDHILIMDQNDVPTLKLYNTKTFKTITNWEISPNIFNKIGHVDDINSNSKIFSGTINVGGIEYGTITRLVDEDKIGGVWDTLIWDINTNSYFIGIIRAKSWGPKDYYLAQEWIEVKI